MGNLPSTRSDCMESEMKRSSILCGEARVGKSSARNTMPVKENSLPIPSVDAQSDALHTTHQLRLVLLGRAGSGKTSAANMILKKSGSPSTTSGAPRTVRQRGAVTNGRDQHDITVVETPDWLSPTMSDDDVTADIARCCSLSAPGPHAFLLVVSLSGPSREDHHWIKVIQEAFGTGALNYVVVLFTHSDGAGGSVGESVTEWNDVDEGLGELVLACGNRHHTFHGDAAGDHPSHVRSLLGKIENMVRGNGGKFYGGWSTQRIKAFVQSEISALNGGHTVWEERAKEREIEVKTTELGNPFVSREKLMGSAKCPDDSVKTYQRKMVAAMRREWAIEKLRGRGGTGRTGLFAFCKRTKVTDKITNKKKARNGVTDERSKKEESKELGEKSRASRDVSGKDRNKAKERRKRKKTRVRTEGTVIKNSGWTPGGGDEGEEMHGATEERGNKGKEKTGWSSEEEEQPGPSSGLVWDPQTEVLNPTDGCLLKKRERKNIWTRPLYKTSLPITCGDKKGLLNRDKLAKGMKSIYSEEQWFTPPDFEKFGGREKSRNWKISIKCEGISLAKLLQKNLLSTPGYQKKKAQITKDKAGSAKAKRVWFSNPVVTESWLPPIPTVEEVNDQGPYVSRYCGDRKVFKVTCGELHGTLHNNRFADRERGLSVRTEKSWMTPVDFVREGLPLCEGDTSWRKVIQWEGNPLSCLIETGNLRIHSLLCDCWLCDGKPENLVNQRNDDECHTCHEESGDLVVCDLCPRSFHQGCHLPNVIDRTIGAACQWMCTFCVLKASQQWCYPRQHTYDSALSCKISDHLMECQYLLLYLYSADENQILVTNSSVTLKQVERKLQQDLYLHVRQFVIDIKDSLNNCTIINQDNAELQLAGEKLMDTFDRQFRSIFSVQRIDSFEDQISSGNVNIFML